MSTPSSEKSNSAVDAAQSLLYTMAHVATRRHQLAKEQDLSTRDLDTLKIVENGPMIVGDVQREVGVLPAQMSRILRGLENAELITETINPRDKRKLNVTITNNGLKVIEQIENELLEKIAPVLEQCSAEFREELMQVMNAILEPIADAVREASQFPLRKNGRVAGNGVHQLEPAHIII